MRVRERPPARRSATAARAPAVERAAAAAAGLLAVAIAGAALLVDVGAEAAFDAPKRLVTVLGLAGAAGVLLVSGRARARVPPPLGLRRVVVVALALALAWTAVAALVSPRGAIARDGFRTLALFAAALPLGASAALTAQRGRWLLGMFLVVVALNAGTSLVQAAGVELLPVAAIAGRSDTGAFLGNEGHLAQVTALATVATLVLVLVPGDRRVRAAAIAASALFLAALVANRNLTALVTLAAGSGLALLLLRGRRALVPIALAALVLAAGIAGHAPLRTRVTEAAHAARGGDWDALTTYRLGPWAAALEMIRERPLFGFGPGTFGAEFAAHRLRAELRWQRRLVIPLLTSSFSEAHSEYLQSAAEGGMPAVLAVTIAAGGLLIGLVRVAAAPADARHPEALLLAAVLAAAAVAALTWFPFQRPVSALPLLLAAGRGWRVLGMPGRRSGAMEVR